MKNTSEFITIIRPSFMKFCGDACRAATLNHLLFRIAGKSKDQPKEKIQSGDILWYATTDQITEEMSNAWGVCKVRSQVNELIGMGLIGRRSNPTWGADRTKHFCFGTEQCEKLLSLCQENGICVVHLGLCPEVMHLIYSSNANDKSIKCTCGKQVANDESIACIRYNHPMHSMDSSRAFDGFIEAIPIDIHKDIHKEEEEDVRMNVSPPTPISSSSQPSSSQQTEKPQQGSLMPEQGKKKKADLPPVSAEAERIIERWIAANGGKPIPMTKALIEAAEALVDCHPSKETLICVKNFAWLNDSNGWYKKHGGVKLGDIVREYEGWQNSQNQAQAEQPPQPSQESAPPRISPLQQRMREQEAKYARNTPQSTRMDGPSNLSASPKATSQSPESLSKAL